MCLICSLFIGRSLIRKRMRSVPCHAALVHNVGRSEAWLSIKYCSFFVGNLEREPFEQRQRIVQMSSSRPPWEAKALSRASAAQATLTRKVLK